MTENSSRTETDPDTSTCTITVRDKPYRIDLAVPNIAKRRLAEALRTEYREYHGIPQASISVGWQHDFGLPPTGTHVSLRQTARIVVERILPKLGAGTPRTLLWELAPADKSDGQPFNLCRRLFLVGVPNGLGPPVPFRRVSASESARLVVGALVAWRCLLVRPCLQHFGSARR